jgi:hypothetical protein
LIIPPAPLHDHLRPTDQTGGMPGSGEAKLAGKKQTGIRAEN